MLKPVLRYVLFPLSLLLTQCKHSGKEALTDAVGKPGSLVIVSDKGTMQSMDGLLNGMFLGAHPEYVSGEPFFEILKPGIPEFLQLFHNQRTILALVSNDNKEGMEDILQPFSKEEVERFINSPDKCVASQQDVFARHQHIIYLFGKNAEDLKYKLALHGKTLLQQLTENDLRDFNAVLQNDTGSNARFTDEFKNKYGISVRIPGAFKLKTESSNFYWFQMDETDKSGEKSIGLIIHAYPFKDSLDFTYDQIRSMRDTFCKHHIPGELPGTYMSTTESDFYPERTSETVKLNGYRACKVRGWWTIKGLTMAGPFVRYVVHVPQKNILFAFEGFVYRPDINLKERDIRMIEAIALSIQ